MRIVFMGTPEFSVPTFHALREAGHDVVAAYTQPPRPAGRGKQERKSPVHLAAEAVGVPVFHPRTLRDLEAQADFLALEAELAVVVAYGLILPKAILEGPRHGCLNVHASLLPRWRGAAPIQRAILAGDHVTGITVMQMEQGLDTGPMLATARVPIEDKTSGELHSELAEIGARLLVDTVAQLGQLEARPQDELGVMHAAKIDKSETRIDWAKPAERIEREVRAFSPFPGSWFEIDPGSGSGAGVERIKLLRARVIGLNGSPGRVLDDKLTVACGDAALRPVTVQRAGKPAMAAEDFLRGMAVPVGTVLR